MKVDKVIFSGDNAYYYLWEPISEVISKVLKIKPVLFFVTENEETDFYEDKFGIVKKIKNPTGFNSGFMGQIYRMYGTKYFQDEVCLISDLDMLLFNRKWLESSLENVDNDHLAILNSDAYDTNRAECVGNRVRYPMCYLVGKGKLFNKILNTDRTIEEFAGEIFDTKAGWDSDEIYFTDKLLKTDHGVPYDLIKRGYSSYYYAPGRIEKYMFDDYTNRDCPGGIIYKLNLAGTVNYDSFIDCHFWRFDNKNLVEKIRKELLELYK